MLDFIREQKTRISAFLSGYLDAEKKRLASIDPIGTDVLDRLLDFSLKGKMLRGALVRLGYSLFGEGNPDVLVRIGGALELLQSALLIHDDIMDRDEYRRGERSVFYQYVNKADTIGYRDAYHVGEALGICAGDLGFFLAFGLVSRIDTDETVRNRILETCATEMCVVSVAQMTDVLNGAKSGVASEESVLRLYRYKTGRYTFSLPLVLGATAAGTTGSVLDELEEIGEILGLVFQLKDDEIGLYGDEKETGKPAGSDIRSGKKTLYSYFLANQAKGDDRAKLDSIFGNQNTTEEDLDYIRDLAERLGVRDVVRQRMEEYGCIAEEKIKRIGIRNEESRENLVRLISYNLNRSF